LDDADIHVFNSAVGCSLNTVGLQPCLRLKAKFAVDISVALLFFGGLCFLLCISFMFFFVLRFVYIGFVSCRVGCWLFW
jgi:hypothetical protein